MERYKNVSGKSGVVEYEIGADFIKVRFKGPKKIYVYNYASTGKEYIENMKKLAEGGKGLSTFVSQKVRERYSHIE